MKKIPILLFFLLGSVFCFSQKNKKDTTAINELALKTFNLGLKLMDSVRYKDAIHEFEKAIKIKPVLYSAYNKIAECKIKLKDLPGATRDLKKLFKVQGIDVDKVIEKSFKKEKGDTGKSFELDGGDVQAMKLLGYIYLSDTKYKEAKLFLDAAVKKNADDPELHYYIGLLKMAGNDVKGANVSFDQALFLRENYGGPYLQKGLIYFKLQNYKYAIRDITRGLQLSPEDSSNLEVFKARGESNFEMGDFQGAIKDFSRIITVDPKNENAYTSRGAAKIEAGDFSGAIDDETKAIELNKNSYVAYNFRGTAKGELKSYAEGIKDLDMSIKLKIDYPSAYVNRASIKFAMKQKKKACDDLYKADQCGSKIAFKLIEKYCKDLEK